MPSRPATKLCRVRPGIPDELDNAADRRVARRAAEEWGVLSLDELRACGLAREAVGVRVRSGRLHRLHRGVYAVGHVNVPREGRYLAAVKACGTDAVLSHRSAAALWGILDADGRHPEVTVPGSGTRVRPGIRVHRASLGSHDRARRAGIPVTAPARTLVDLASVLPYRPLRRAVRQAQSLRLLSVRHALDGLERAGQWRGRRALAAILADGPAPTRSELEDVVLDLVRRSGLAPPDVNVPLVVAGRRIVPDFRWPEQRLVVEADGAAWHDHRLAREEDAERQAVLESSGERVVRITWRQAIARPDETLARLRAAGAPVRSAAPRQRTPTRSTTKTSVSSGPMTPPAPRLP